MHLIEHKLCMNNEQSHAGSDEPLVFEQKMEGYMYIFFYQWHQTIIFQQELEKVADSIEEEENQEKQEVDMASKNYIRYSKQIKDMQVRYSWIFIMQIWHKNWNEGQKLMNMYYANIK